MTGPVKCATHHYACDCREATMKEIVRAFRSVQATNDLHSVPITDADHDRDCVYCYILRLAEKIYPTKKNLNETLRKQK